jgi:hypothetical protein
MFQHFSLNDESTVTDPVKVNPDAIPELMLRVKALAPHKVPGAS